MVQPSSTRVLTEDKQRYWRQDRMTAAGGENTVTLGATPLTGSLLLWVNGSVKWGGGVDYTLSGATVSITGGLSAGQVVMLQYSTTDAAAGAASLSLVALVADTFNRTDSTSSLGTTTTGSKTWTQHQGTWGISSNRAYRSSSTQAVQVATVDAAVADCTLSVKLTSGTPGAPDLRYFGLAARFDSTGQNGYVVQVFGPDNLVNIQEVTGGTGTAIGANVAWTYTSGDVLSLVLSGSTLTVKMNGTTLFSRTDSTYATQTRHGLYSYADQGFFDDFTVAT